MNAKACAALAAVGVVAGSVALRPQDQKDQKDSGFLWRAAGAGVGAAAAWASDALGAGSHEAGRLASDLRREASTQAQSWPGLLAAPAAFTPRQIAAYEKQLCDLANRERRKRGLPALQISPALAEVARAHSREMAARNYFAHESPTKSLHNPQDRYRARFKKTPRLVAENIYKLEGSGFYRLQPADFARAHDGWMHSPGHRANILRTSPAGGPTQIGVGIVVRGGSFWATQNFARP